MMTASVLVQCDHSDDDDDYCEAEFEVLSNGLPAELQAIVGRQLELRGWSVSTRGKLTCPLHLRPVLEPSSAGGQPTRKEPTRCVEDC
jgi:hypothetical protein